MSSRWRSALRAQLLDGAKVLRHQPLGAGRRTPFPLAPPRCHIIELESGYLQSTLGQQDRHFFEERARHRGPGTMRQDDAGRRIDRTDGEKFGHGNKGLSPRRR
jgi:hypothetical protein